MDHSTFYEETKTKKLILSALMAALTCVGTMIIKVPTPTMGYIHPGDGFVLLSGLLLGPLWGALAAGMQGLVFTGYEDACEKLRMMGVEF